MALRQDSISPSNSPSSQEFDACFYFLKKKAFKTIARKAKHVSKQKSESRIWRNLPNHSNI
jgi:hypothetical protein